MWGGTIYSYIRQQYQRKNKGKSFSEQKNKIITQSLSNLHVPLNYFYYLSFSEANLNDANELGKIISDAYNIITKLNIELPAQPGYLEITFTSSGKTKPFRVLFSAIKFALEAGKTEAELVALSDW